MPPKKRPVGQASEEVPAKKKKTTATNKKTTANNRKRTATATPKKTQPAKKKDRAGGKTPVTKSIKTSNTGKEGLMLVLKDLIKDDRWKEVLADEFNKEYFKNLQSKLQKEYSAGKEIFPPKDLIFNALHLTPLDKVKVVILGQDPYHDNGQAMGMSFSVPKGVPVPPSLRNIYKELEREIKDFKIPDHGCLEKWANEGILMLNATLTVEAHKANSHSSFGWQTFTDRVIQTVSDCCDHVVFILWGGFAHKKEKLVDTKKHTTIKTAHPSPLSLNKFKNCNCFSDCDDALVKFGYKPINWSV